MNGEKRPYVGVAVDVYHLWWDPDLKSEIKRCGKNGNLHAFQRTGYPAYDICGDEATGYFVLAGCVLDIDP